MSSPMLGPDAPVVVNEKGGMQSKTAGRFDLVPGSAIMRIAQVLEYGADRYAVNNWRLIPYESHVNHALQHLAALLEDDEQDDHLGHALTRLAMAVAVYDPECKFKALPQNKAAEVAPESSAVEEIRLSFAVSNCATCFKDAEDCIEFQRCLLLDETKPTGSMGGDTINDVVEELREECLHGGGQITRGGKWYCRICGAELHGRSLT